MKKKLVLMVICLFIIVGIFVRNVGIHLKDYERVKKDGTNQASILMDGEGITRAQIAKMLSFLFYSETESNNMIRIITYKDIKLDDWYDGYVNAMKTIGLLGENKEDSEYRPNEFLTYNECNELLNQFVIICNDESEGTKILVKDITDGLTFSFEDKKKDEPMLVTEWFSVYDNLLKQMKRLHEEVITKSPDMVNNFFTQSVMITEKSLYIIGTEKVNEDSNDTATVTDDKVYTSKGIELSGAVDTSIKTYVSEEAILCVKEKVKEEVTLSNVYIESSQNQKITVFINGIEKTFLAENELSKEVKEVVGDLIIKDKKVIKIKIKPDIISGKVLVATDKYVELEDYGKIELEEKYKIYKLYDGLSMELTNSILVGYKNADFVMSEGKISAVLIKDSIKAENIRVLLKTDMFKNIFHEQVKFKVNGDFKIIYDKKEKSFKAGETVTIKKSSKYLANGRLKIEPKDADSQITLLSLTRSSGNPSYRGSIEIATHEEGMTLINELPLEEYLYSVVPSEMPTTYGTEALKVQAICARSYAYNQLIANSYSTYGAHVDDSVSYQVYNNYPETKESVLAVKDTFGKVLEYNHNIVLAYYFSTSCGYTTSAKDVWGANGELKYLAGKLQSEKSESLNLSEEDAFRQFILKDDINTYDKEFPWYRWKTTIAINDLKKTIDGNLATRYAANPKLILTLVKKGEKEEFRSLPISTVGEVKDIEVVTRGTGGIITELLIKGSSNTVKVITEYNIRVVLAPLYDDIIRQDDTKVSNLSMLPSAFFVVDEKKENGKLTAFTFTGGGYGHGVGMSQNGVKAMAEAGKTYEQILTYYYDGTELAYIYSE